MKVRIKELAIVLVVIISILQRALCQINSVFNYTDEVITLLFLCLFIFSILAKRNIEKNEGIVLILILGIIIVGIIGNIKSGYYRSIQTIIKGINGWIKSFLLYVTCGHYFSNNKINFKKVINYVGIFTKIMISTAFVGLIISPFTKIGINTVVARMRYGMNAYHFIYGKAAILSWYCVAFAMILICDKQYRNRGMLKYAIMLSIVWASTLRSRAFVYIAIFWLLYFIIFCYRSDKFKRIKLWHIIVFSGMGILIGWSAIEKYFGDDTTTRSILLRTGIKIMKKYFPLGAGFGNYGTSASFTDYSPLYYTYGFNNIYRLNISADGMTELTDCYWPAVAGELGVIGLIIIIAILVVIGGDMIKKSRNNKYAYFTVLLLIISSLFSSIATAVYSSDVMILYVLCACIGINNNEVEKRLAMKRQT